MKQCELEAVPHAGTAPTWGPGWGCQDVPVQSPGAPWGREKGGMLGGMALSCGNGDGSHGTHRHPSVVGVLAWAGGARTFPRVSLQKNGAGAEWWKAAEVQPHPHPSTRSPSRPGHPSLPAEKHRWMSAGGPQPHCVPTASHTYRHPTGARHPGEPPLPFGALRGRGARGSSEPSTKRTVMAMSPSGLHLLVAQ